MTATRSKTDGQLARVATNLGIGVVGLVIVRLIVLSLPMFKDAGWIVENKLTVLAGAVIIVDAMLLTVLIRFAIEFRAYVVGRFPKIPGLGTMAANLVLLVTVGIAYTDFKPLMRAWPSIKLVYLWGFFIAAAVLLVHMIVLLYQNRDGMAALILRQPIPSSASEQSSKADESTHLFARH
ncbi:MAG: hypothetical protein L0Z53_23265 [Acidobacteriales bacterium]|nr:hypothetical protein [Terriglobales bacterium]